MLIFLWKNVDKKILLDGSTTLYWEINMVTIVQHSPSSWREKLRIKLLSTLPFALGSRTILFYLRVSDNPSWFFPSLYFYVSSSCDFFSLFWRKSSSFAVVLTLSKRVLCLFIYFCALDNIIRRRKLDIFWRWRMTWLLCWWLQYHQSIAQSFLMVLLS